MNISSPEDRVKVPNPVILRLIEELDEVGNRIPVNYVYPAEFFVTLVKTLNFNWVQKGHLKWHVPF